MDQPPVLYTDAPLGAGDEKSQVSGLPMHHFPGQSITVTSGYNHEESPRRRRRTFIRLFHATILFVVAFTLLPQVTHKLFPSLNTAGEFSYGGLPGNLEFGSTSLPEDCAHLVEWKHVVRAPHNGPHEYHHFAETSLELPVSADLLYFVSEGALSHGHIEITDSVDLDAESDAVKVDVQFMSRDEDALDMVQVCLLQKEENKHGVGLFSPRWSRRSNTRFSVHVELPASTDKPRKIKAFETNMPLFRHEIGDLQKTVRFDDVSLASANTPLHVKSLAALRAHLHTTNSPITGNFNVTHSIKLQTTNAPILVDVTLVNDGGKDTINRLDAQTTNSPASVDVSLVSSANNGTGGSFEVFVKSANCPVDVKYKTAPIDSVLNFEASTTNSHVSSTLYKTFEGDFSVRTSPWFPVDVRMEAEVEDPTGKGRKRHLESSVIGRGVNQGKVWWEKADEEKGKQLSTASLSTTNSPAHLYL